MKLNNLTPTDRIERFQGSPARLWTGTTDAGVPVHVWVHSISPQTHDPSALAVFETALKHLPVVRELVSFDHRMVASDEF